MIPVKFDWHTDKVKSEVCFSVENDFLQAVFAQCLDVEYVPYCFELTHELVAKIENYKGIEYSAKNLAAWGETINILSGRIGDSLIVERLPNYLRLGVVIVERKSIIEPMNTKPKPLILGMKDYPQSIYELEMAFSEIRAIRANFEKWRMMWGMLGWHLGEYILYAQSGLYIAPTKEHEYKISADDRKLLQDAVLLDIISIVFSSGSKDEPHSIDMSVSGTRFRSLDQIPDLTDLKKEKGWM